MQDTWPKVGKTSSNAPLWCGWWKSASVTGPLLFQWATPCMQMLPALQDDAPCALLPGHDGAAPCAQNFIQDGSKGEDFNRNLYNSYLDFATIHVYPQNLGVPGPVFFWVDDNYIGTRAVRFSGIMITDVMR